MLKVLINNNVASLGNRVNNDWSKESCQAKAYQLLGFVHVDRLEFIGNGIPQAKPIGAWRVLISAEFRQPQRRQPVLALENRCQFPDFLPRHPKR